MKTIVEFNSCLKDKFESYLKLRESQGHNAAKERHMYISLDQYLISIRHIENNLSATVIDGWIASLPNDLSANTVNVYISHYIQFAKYLQSFGYCVFFPERIIKDRNYIAYVFSKEELFSLITTTDKGLLSMPNERQHNMKCFSIMLRMAVGCGLRLNEIRLLKTENVDLNNGTILIKNAKGNKDRIVPMHESLSQVLKIYLHSKIPQEDGLFFPSNKGEAITLSWIRDAFIRTLKDTGIERPQLEKHSRNICFHCLRHSFAVLSLRQLSLNGADLYSEIPILSTYMGHENIYGTEHYLHSTTENNQDILLKMESFNKGVFPEVDE